MPSSCPTDAALESFARGAGDPAGRDLLAAHVRTCETCQARFLPMALASSALDQTNFDSPAARRRKDREQATPPPAIAPDIGLDDTYVSGETEPRAIPHTTSGVKKGEALDRYVILDRLGAGGMGEVYAAWDPVLDRKVAVKVLRGDFDDRQLSDELRQRLLREAQSLAKLSHPNVVTVHDVGIAGDRVFLAMEFAEGETLKKWLERKPRPSWRKTLELFLLAGEGLAAAHAQGITHRDFKPENVVVGPDGRVRVMDFGLAHEQAAKKKPSPSGELPRTITQPGAMLGTPAYMSPEALHGRTTDFRSDVFSFCVSLYEGLYGIRPFEGATPGAIAVEIDAHRVRPPPKDTEVPRRIHQLILKGLRAEPLERFQTLRALLIQLGRRRSTREQQITVAAISALALLAVGLMAWGSYRARTRCGDVDDRLIGVWDPAVKAKARAAFEATKKPWAMSAWHEVESRLDAYSKDWTGMRRAACESSAERDDELLGQEILCLSRRLIDLEATTALLSRADAEIVERAVTTATALPPLSGCRRTSVTTSAAPSEPLRPQLSSVKALLDAGKFTDALALASDVAARADAAGDRAALAEARLWAAVAKIRTGDAKAADTLLEESILAAQIAHDDELQARAWVERVGVAALSGPSPDADRWVRFARATLERVGSPAELEAMLANNLGVLAYYRQQWDAAIEAHQRALTLRRQLFGEKHPLVARSHSNLGIAFKGLGRLDDARAQYERALAIDEAALDPSHPQVAETLNNLGNVLQAQNQPTLARRALERSLRIKEDAFGRDSLPVAVTLTNLGVLLLDLQELAEADRVLTRGLQLKELKAGSDALTVAISLTNLAQAKRAAKDWKASLELDARALTIRTRRQGPSHVDLAFNLTGLGEARVMTDDLPAARQVLEQALSLRRDRGAERAVTAYWLARALEGTKDTRLRSLLEEAVADLPTGSPATLQLREDALARLRR